eukprot:3697475-Pleurochrysis_carterae.AAC.1
MCLDDARNKLIALVLLEAYARGRKSIVLSDRIAHLRAINSFLEERKPHAVIRFYIGKSSPSERKMSVDADILLTSFTMAKEGLDIARLDTLLLATPKTDIEQCVGRVQRPHKDKKPVVVIDVCDVGSVSMAMYRKRQAHYNQKAYDLHECT